MSAILSFDIGIKNLAYCKIDTETKQPIDWKDISLIETFKCSAKKCSRNATIISKDSEYFCDKHKPSTRNYRRLVTAKNCNLCDISRKLLNALETIETDNIISVVIENQLTSNPKMKFIGSAVLFYFSTKLPDINVRFISAKYKLSDFTTKLKGKKNYSSRKKLAIEKTEELIESPEMLEYFRKHKKRDDLADSFLQGFFCLSHEFC